MYTVSYKFSHKKEKFSTKFVNLSTVDKTVTVIWQFNISSILRTKNIEMYLICYKKGWLKSKELSSKTAGLRCAGQIEQSCQFVFPFCFFVLLANSFILKSRKLFLLPEA